MGRVLQQLGDLIDVVSHGSCRALAVSLAQGRHHGLVSPDGSHRAALLFQRELARFHEQIVQGRHDADDHAIARGASEDAMKRRVLDDGRPAALELLALRVENPLQVGEIFTGHARGRDAGHGGLEHAAHVQQLVLEIVAVAQDRGQRRHQPVDVQLLRKRALAVTRREQTDGFQRAERVADRPAADAEPSGELALGEERRAGGEGAVENQHSDAVGALLGDTRLSDRLDHERLSLRGPLPGTAGPLGTSRNGCRTHRPDGFDHRATLTHCGSRNADCGLRIKLRIGIAGRDLKQPIFNSIRNPQSEIRNTRGGFGVHRKRIAPRRVTRDRGIRPRPGPCRRHRRTVGERRHGAVHGGHRGQERRVGHRAHQPRHDSPRRRRRGADRRASRRRTAEPSRAGAARRRVRTLRPSDPEPVSSRAMTMPPGDRPASGRVHTRPAGTLTLRVAEARVEDIGHAIARLAPDDLVRIGARPGDILKITGTAVAVARAELSEEGQKGSIQIDGTARSNCGAGLQEQVSVAPVESAQAVAVRFSPLWEGAAPAIIAPERMLEDLQGVPVVAGCVVRVPTYAKAVNFQVARTIPSGPVVIGKRTDIRLVDGEQTAARAPAVSYEDIGGLEREVARVREIVELPLKHSRIFERLGILAPKGVLLYGPPGTGKTLLARAVAAESRVHFIHLNGPEIMRKFYGESEAKLREVFEEAARRAPSILFIDEIDAVAPKRAEVSGEVEKRVVAQLLSLMDGFVSRGQVIVIGATNIPEVLDPALRRPGRFDREIEIGVPNTQGRLQILKIHTRAMPLGPDVDLRDVADHSHGFVGADLEALCQEVGMVALRRFLSTSPVASGFSRTTPNQTVQLKPDATDEAGDLARLQVTRDDWLAGLKEVEPSATREFLVEKSPSRFASLGGLDDVKRLLDAVGEHAHMHDDIYEQVGLAPPRGILLVGPSGTGKTGMARALSGEKEIPHSASERPALYSKSLRKRKGALREVFKKARRATPCLLFFDTIDAIAPRLGADHGLYSGADVYQR